MEALLAAEPISAARARQLVTDALRRSRCEALADVAELLVSELVTNAILHARTDVTVRVDVDTARLRVEVRDETLVEPQLRRYREDATTGRGMFLVETLASRWGSQAHQGGKAVWFELDRQAA